MFIINILKGWIFSTAEYKSDTRAHIAWAARSWLLTCAVAASLKTSQTPSISHLMHRGVRFASLLIWWLNYAMNLTVFRLIKNSQVS